MQSVLSFKDSITKLGRIGSRRAEQFAKLGIHTIGDLLTHYPRAYIDYTSPVEIADAPEDTQCVVKCEVVRKLAPARIRSGMTIFKFIAADESGEMTVTIYNSKYQFESIYPFYDGNGRTGRILNILYLVLNKHIFKRTIRKLIL